MMMMMMMMMMVIYQKLIFQNNFYNEIVRYDIFFIFLVWQKEPVGTMIG